MTDRSREVALGTPTGFLAFGLGSGLSPVAPGTAGTLAALLPGLWLVQLPVWLGLVMVAAAFGLGIWLCSVSGRALEVHDHGGIVWDEFVGMWLVLVLIVPDWRCWLAGFLAFRLFDILKPFPILWLDQRVPGGFGVMLDDLLAAVYALALLGLVSLTTGWPVFQVLA